VEHRSAFLELVALSARGREDLATSAGMNPTELPGGKLPSFEDRERMWRELVVSKDPGSRPAFAAYSEALRTVYTSGEVRAGSFRVEPHPVFDWYASRSQFREMGFFERIWSLPSVHELMPEPLLGLNFYSKDVLGESSPFLLGGSMAWALSSGGAGTRHARGSVDAKRLADAAAAELVRDRYDEVRVFESGEAWSKFFLDVAWDNTWIVLDERLVHVVCATDSD
jgi:hypothetical protein